MRCKNCLFCDVRTDEEYCKKLVCTKTSRKGRCISWHMSGAVSGAGGEPVNIYRYFANLLDKNKTPKWCPLEKEGNTNPYII